MSSIFDTLLVRTSEDIHRLNRKTIRVVMNDVISANSRDIITPYAYALDMI